MEKKNGNNFDRDVSDIASSPAAQKLLTLLQQQNRDELKEVQNSALSGNYEQALNTLSSILNSPDAKKLLSELEEAHGRHE